MCLNADSLPSANTALLFEEQALPVSPVRALSSTVLDAHLKSLEAQLRTLRRARLFAGCKKVSPLSDIEDAEALEFEKNSEVAPVDVSGLMPDTAQALDTLRELVTSAGGTFDLKSAYRPPAYQAHLHEVWVKWKQLRGNKTAGCRALREDVRAEFERHQLLVRQQPVPVSDHTAGRAFDAAVAMPRGARLNGKRVTLDKLAALAGTKRPEKRRDPVHFKLIPVRPSELSYVQPISF